MFIYEDYVRDINALIEHIGSGLTGELDASRIAVMGGSCKYPFIPRLTHA